MQLLDLIRASVPLGTAWALELGAAYVALVAIARAIGPPALGTTAAVIAALLVAGAYPVTSVARHLGSPSRSPHATVSDRGATLGAVASVTLLLNADLLIAWSRLPTHDAGVYAGAAALTRVLVLVPAAWATLVLSRRRPPRDRDPFRWLHRSLAATTMSLILAGGAIAVFRTPLTEAVLGSDFAGSARLIPILTVTGASCAIVWQLSFLHLAVVSRAHILLLVVVAAELVATSITVTPETLAAVCAVGAMVGAALQYVGARAVTRWSPPLSSLRPHREVTPSPPRSDHDIELSLILPCHNTGPALGTFLESVLSELRDEVGGFELIVVSDGSTDGSVEIATRLDPDMVRVLHYAERSGKGHALRVGLHAARGDFVGFIDADGDIDPRALRPFLSLMRTYGPDVVLGSKRHPMSQVTYPPTRRAMSWVYHKLTRLLFRVNVRDTQTGLKLVRRDVLAEVLPRMFEKRYAFDLELLVVARLLGFTNVFEAPVKIDYRFSSNVDAGAVGRILLDTTAIFYRRYILDTYRRVDDRLMIVRDDDTGTTPERTDRA